MGEALPITPAHALASARLLRHHDDPFERMLVAYGVRALWQESRPHGSRRILARFPKPPQTPTPFSVPSTSASPFRSRSVAT